MADIILETQALAKEFGGFIAVNGVDLQVRRHSIHALIGPNGAGKTTMFNLVTKFLLPTRGKIFFNGHEITYTKPATIARQGMVRSFQISAVFPNLTLTENVRIALQNRHGSDAYRFWRSERSLEELNDRAEELIEAVGLSEFISKTAGELSYGRKRALEIATTLALEPELMLLDEPMAGMGHEDIDRTADLIHKVSPNRTILMVEHNLSVVARLANTITVLQRGEVLAEGPYSEVSVNPDVRRAYMGSATAH